MGVTLGWRWMWARWHYFKDGESLCKKFSAQIIGGGVGRRGVKTTLSAEDLARRDDGNAVCAGCSSELARQRAT